LIPHLLCNALACDVLTVSLLWCSSQRGSGDVGGRRLRGGAD
jgi:hypothetical protein